MRDKWDAAADRWVPHVTLIPPFRVPLSLTATTRDSAQQAETQMPSSSATWDLVEVSRRIESVLSHCQKYRLALDDVDVFKLHRYWNVHLRPSTSSGDNASRTSFLNMQTRLADALNDVNQDAARGGNQNRHRHSAKPFAPHASLGQAHDAGQLEHLKALAHGICAAAKTSHLDPSSGGSEGQSLEFDVDPVALMVKPQSRKGPYDIWKQLELGE